MKCLTWTLIAISNWVSLSRLALLTLLFGSLAIGFGALFLASKIRRILLKKTVLRVKPVNVITEQMAGLKRNSKSIALMVLGAILATPIAVNIGKARARAEFAAERHHYTDVLVRTRADARHFMLQPLGQEPWPAESCSDLGWQPGWKMKWADFQFGKNGCMDFNEHGSFQCYHDHAGRCLTYQQEIVDARY